MRGWNTRAFGLTILLLGACASNLPPELRDPEKHVRPVERGAEATPVFVPDLVAEARLRSGEEACEILRAAAVAGEAGARDGFAACVLEAGEADRAWALLENSPSPLREVAGLLSGQIVVSEERLNHAIGQAPGHAQLWNLLGREYERQGRDAEAVDAYLKAKQLG